MNKTEMTEYLKKEIETLSTNTMTFRSRIAFSVFIGPFLLLGSIIVSASKNGLNLTSYSWSAVIPMFIALVAFWLLGTLCGRVEQGHLNRCNKWRECIIRLQKDDELTIKQLEDLILDKPSMSLARVYAGAFLLIIIAFGATAYLAAALVKGG
jgi:hypothetical protein